MEVALQIVDGILYPHSDIDKEEVSELKQFQIIRAKITGVRKPRSYKQLKAYWACCKTVSDNTENEQWNTREKVDLQIRMRTQFFDLSRTIICEERVVFCPRSINYKNLRHMESCRYFDRAFEIMAKFLEVTVEELLKMGKQI